MTPDQSATQSGTPSPAPKDPKHASPPQKAATKAAPVKKRKISERQREARRRFLRSLGFGSVILAATLSGVYPVLKRLTERLRPPGAIDEDAFLAACIKCGQCVQVCPVEAIKLADLDEGFGIGVPYIDARAQACDFSCDATQCILACPTGALDHAITKKEEVTMGFAKLVEPEHCLAMLGQGFKGTARGPDFDGLLRYEEIDRWTPIKVAHHSYDLDLCDLCVRECPIEGAISLEPVSSDPADKRREPVIHKSCVGCGTCEMMCPVEPVAIVIEPEVSMEAAS
ncbi:MAG: 4Fe-4S dicluster domain-containing protein [Cohaesibacter sp.]|nr:4Fe-4S dicluster domain-containing protein [Cohaesibacter sp.]MCV6600845.1 4Fe-4S dicluster domain-containing protein [Cohaesibacter sp.]